MSVGAGKKTAVKCRNNPTLLMNENAIYLSPVTHGSMIVALSMDKQKFLYGLKL